MDRELHGILCRGLITFLFVTFTDLLKKNLVRQPQFLRKSEGLLHFNLTFVM